MEGSGYRDERGARGRWTVRGGKGPGGSSGAGAGTTGVWSPPQGNSEQRGIWETEVRGTRAAGNPFGDFGAQEPGGCPSAEGTGLLPVVWG